MSNTKLKKAALELAFDIEANRQRLNHAMAVNDKELEVKAVKVLTSLQSQFYDTVKPVFNISKDITHLMLFSDKHRSGIVITYAEYKAIYRRMSPMDRETHIVVEVDPGTERDVEAAIEAVEFDSSQDDTDDGGFVAS